MFNPIPHKNADLHFPVSGVNSEANKASEQEQLAAVTSLI